MHLSNEEHQLLLSLVDAQLHHSGYASVLGFSPHDIKQIETFLFSQIQAQQTDIATTVCSALQILEPNNLYATYVSISLAIQNNHFDTAYQTLSNFKQSYPLNDYMKLQEVLCQLHLHTNHSPLNTLNELLNSPFEDVRLSAQQLLSLTQNHSPDTGPLIH